MSEGGKHAESETAPPRDPGAGRPAFTPAAGRGTGQVSTSGQNGIFRREGPVMTSV